VLDPDQAAELAGRFALGDHAVLKGPVAAGRLGDVWRLSTDRGDFAVKDARFPVDPAEVAADAAYQDRVAASGPVDRWYVDALGEPVWRDLVARLHSARAPFAGRLESLLPEVLAAEALLVETDPVQVCHRDLWADNVLRTPDEGLVVLDWENSGPGDPAGELGVVLFEFGQGDDGRMRELFASYVDAGGPARLRTPGDLTMLIAQTGHIARTGCERWLSAATDEERADNAAWVGEFLDEPLTVATVEAILDAAR